ncbi:5773_t:CDS:2 [Racocetra fulgida]|uniref:5773_t:CDS:1 n=1 Tax=Racocetra fulgida TaxID=60492 RepID=A0A9N8ZXS6_9GLOM|nr:5773_t:CDS:2 [Racocetra fulgida]
MTRNTSSNGSKKNPNDEQPMPRNNRTKNTSSCNYCRINKVRCDYLRDGRCRQCINHNRICISDPQKKRGPKGKKAPGSSIKSREKNLQNLGEAFLRSIRGGSQDLDDLVRETRSQNRTLNENSSRINNSESMLSPAINNEQIIIRSPRTPSPTRENQQRINNELEFDLHGNVSNPNTLSYSSTSNMVPMYSGNQQQTLPVLQIPEITSQNFADLRTVSPMEIIGLNGEVDLSPIVCSTPNNTFNQSPALTGDFQLMSMPMLSPLLPADPQAMSVPLFDDPSPLLPASLQPMSGDASPLTDFTQVMIVPSLEVSPLNNFFTYPQAMIMSPLDLGSSEMSFPDLNDETYINSTTNPQTVQHLLSVPPRNRFHQRNDNFDNFNRFMTD